MLTPQQTRHDLNYLVEEHNTTKRRSYAALIVLLMLSQSSNAQSVTMPSTFVTVTDVTITNNKCSSWMGSLTVTAVPYSATTMSSWDWHYNRYSLDASGSNDLHAHQTDEIFLYETNNTFRGTTPAEKAREMNKYWLGSEDPSPGTSRRTKTNHTGSCAADYGNQECIGIFVGDDPVNLIVPGGRPKTVPDGVCHGVPIPNRFCEFTSPAITIDHGTIPPGRQHSIDTPISLRCYGSITYSLKAVSPPTTLSLTINGSPIDGIWTTRPDGMQVIPLTTTIRPTQSGRYQETVILRISVE